jgi:hypothetical protein
LHVGDCAIRGDGIRGPEELYSGHKGWDGGVRLEKYGDSVVIYACLVGEGGAGGEYVLVPVPGVNTTTVKPPAVALQLPK